MTELAQKIYELRSQGKTYNEIIKILNCSKGTLNYYLAKNGKEKSIDRIRKYRSKHPYVKKLEHFKCKNKTNTITKPQSSKNKQIIQRKIHRFLNRKKNNMSTQFTYEDVIAKFGENPKCYLTGKPIDIYKPRTYQFDHIIPTSKGGPNTLENLGICTKAANLSKSELLIEEFLELCQDVLKNHGFKIEKLKS